jgi:hypothetical protein
LVGGASIKPEFKTIVDTVKDKRNPKVNKIDTPENKI